MKYCGISYVDGRESDENGKKTALAVVVVDITDFIVKVFKGGIDAFDTWHAERYAEDIEHGNYVGLRYMDHTTGLQLQLRELITKYQAEDALASQEHNKVWEEMWNAIDNGSAAAAAKGGREQAKSFAPVRGNARW